MRSPITDNTGQRSWTTLIVLVLFIFTVASYVCAYGPWAWSANVRDVLAHLDALFMATVAAYCVRRWSVGKALPMAVSADELKHNV